MKIRHHALECLAIAALALSGCGQKPAVHEQQKSSSQCRPCHAAFYQDWATSHHGLAMQPFTTELSRSQLTTQNESIAIGSASYRARLDDPAPHIEETSPGSKRKLPIVQVLGGKTTYYFLTELDRGRLQVLPLAFNVRKKTWYNMAASGVRIHAEGAPAAPPAWTDSAFTFNTSCYSCHVSALKTNYDAASDTYRTVWKEPGINCETCHGDGEAHIALMKQGGKPDDLRILRVSRMTPAARNEMCAPCHAKMNPLSAAYQVTQRFFDHYDLTALESSDFYPDGRDLGENYTYTSWLMSPCVKNGRLDCMHCHTSAGRFKFANADTDRACLPCHENIAAQGEEHSHHKPATAGGRCIDCHMPQTRFANMNRTDHSMLPPAPAATVRFQSPNACGLCHADRGAAWADALVRKWYRKDYQSPVIERAVLIDDARHERWTRLPAILAYLKRSDADPIFAASLLRLLRRCADSRKWPAFIEKLSDPNPLVRAAAASGFAEAPVEGDALEALLKATRDEYRLVRIRAAASLAGAPLNADLSQATGELIASYEARPDDFGNLTNLGNFHLRRGDTAQALQAFERAIRLRPDSVGTLVNASVAYSRAGKPADAERVLRQALQYGPQNAAVQFNLGLLLAEAGRPEEAQKALRAALAADPKLAPAAYNLSVLVSKTNLDEAIGLCRRASALQPAEPKYATALAQFLFKGGQTAEAVRVLNQSIGQQPRSAEPYALLAAIYQSQGRPQEAARAYRLGTKNPHLPPPVQAALEAKAAALR